MLAPAVCPCLTWYLGSSLHDNTHVGLILTEEASHSILSGLIIAESSGCYSIVCIKLVFGLLANSKQTRCQIFVTT